MSKWKIIAFDVLVAILFILLSSINIYADQCAVFPKLYASQALKYLNKGTIIYNFCLPCGDASPKAEIIQDVRVSQSEFSSLDCTISVNGEQIDLAYIYVPVFGGEYKNLANIVNCHVEDVPEYLSKEMIKLSASAPAPAPIPAPIPAPTPTGGLSQKGEAEISQVEAQNFKDKTSPLKYGYVDLQEAVYKSSAGIKAKQELENLIKQKQALIDMKEKKIQEFKQKTINPNMKESLMWLGAFTLWGMEEEKKKLIEQSEKDIRTKDQELKLTVLKELLWKIKRLGKTDNYGLILNKKGLGFLEKDALKDDSNEHILYRNSNFDTSKISTLGIEDFDDITQDVIAFFDKGEFRASEQTTGITSEIQTREVLKELPKINISVEVFPELFPVIAKFLSEGNDRFNIPGLVKWKLHNEGSETVKISITSEVTEWTPPVINTVDIGPYEQKELIQTPFGIKLLKNHETIPALVTLKAKIGDKLIFEETKNIKIRAADTMLWSLYSPWDTEFLIAAWITPKDRTVEQVLSRAKEKLFGRSLSGYQSNVQEQTRAIFNAVRGIGVSYVNSTINFGQVGFTQAVQLPRDSINLKRANCIDGAVLLASLFENIGLESLIILIPGHAFVGVRLSPGSRETLFIETTLLGREMLESVLTVETTFDAAVRVANEKFSKARYESQYKPDALHIIDIKKAREMGIYPLWQD